MKFRRDSDEECCDFTVPGTDLDPKHAAYGGLACLRRKGHVAPCIARVEEAALADGVCRGCREPLESPHKAECSRRPRMTHDLKCCPDPYQAVASGEKTYEIRVSDRPFQVGDSLLLREWDPDDARYTGASLTRRVTYITTGGQWGLPDNLCVLALAKVPNPSG